MAFPPLPKPKLTAEERLERRRRADEARLRNLLTVLNRVSPHQAPDIEEWRAGARRQLEAVRDPEMYRLWALKEIPRRMHLGPQGKAR